MTYSLKLTNNLGNSSFISTISIFILLFACSVHAERISVVSNYGSQGQGWLFGSSQGGTTIECWIVTPAHVVEGEGGELAAPFRFSDRRGNTGYSGLPVTAAQIDYPGKIEGLDFDVAFAKVKSGRKAGDCISRLGLPDLSYETVIKSLPEIGFFNLIETSFGVFTLKLDRVAVDEMGGSIIAMKSNDPAVVAMHFQQGLSGAIGEVSWQDQQYPFAMVSRVRPDSSQVFGVRFDVIRQLFTHLDVNRMESNSSHANYSIVSVKVNPTTAMLDPEVLLTAEKCWTAEPSPNEKHIEILLEVPADSEAIHGIALRQGIDCGNSNFAYSVDQRSGDSSNWVRVGDCVSSNAKINGIDCPMDMRAPRQLRVLIESVDAVSFSQVIIY